MEKSEQINELAKALCQFQGKVKNPKKTANNPHFSRKYTPLDELVNTIKPVLQEFGLSYFQNSWTEDENIVVQTMLLHESGQWLNSDPLKLPGHQTLKGGGKAWNAQGAGSAITYARRYQLSSILGIASEEDDDGNDVSEPVPSQNSQNSRQSEYRKPQSQSPTGQAPAAEKPPGAPAATDGEPKKISPAQIGRIKTLTSKVAKAAGKEAPEVEEKLKSEFKYQSTTELTSKAASSIIDKLLEWESKYNTQAS